MCFVYGFIYTQQTTKIEKDKVCLKRPNTKKIKHTHTHTYTHITHKRRRKSNKDRTFAFIKPDAFDKVEEIKAMIVKNGFTIVQSRQDRIIKEQAQKFYEEHRNKPFYDELCEHMASGNTYT